MNSLKKVSKFNIFVVLILILESIVLSGIILSLTADHSENSKYVLYIGLNDKDGGRSQNTCGGRSKPGYAHFVENQIEKQQH